MLLLIKPINKEKSLYIDTFNRKNLASINKKILDKSEATKMSDVKYITFESKYTIST